MSDYIDREQAIDAVLNTEPLIIEIGGVSYVGQKTGDVISALQALPPARQWIPCSERLPEDDTLMLVNYIDERPDAMDIWIGWHEMENVWYIDGEEHSREHGNEVIAWMPLPEPFREDGGTDE